MAKYRQGGWNKTPKPTGYKMNSFKHNFLKCSCGKKHCRVCSKQIENVCTKCGLSKETLTTSCCGSPLTKESFESVQNGTLDYHVEKGGWIHINKDGESDGTAIEPSEAGIPEVGTPEAGNPEAGNPAGRITTGRIISTNPNPCGEQPLTVNGGYSAWRANRASNQNSVYVSNESDYPQGNLGSIQEEIGGGPYDSVDEYDGCDDEYDGCDETDDVVAINEIKRKVIKKVRKSISLHGLNEAKNKDLYGYNPISAEPDPRRRRRSKSPKLEKPKKIKIKPRKKA